MKGFTYNNDPISREFGELKTWRAAAAQGEAGPRFLVYLQACNQDAQKVPAVILLLVVATSRTA